MHKYGFSASPGARSANYITAGAGGVSPSRHLVRAGPDHGNAPQPRTSGGLVVRELNEGTFYHYQSLLMLSASCWLGTRWK